ncbi:MAG: histidine phosphatase family protein [Solirubrobacteraceae bacterium]
MTDFVLVRHGETEWSAQARYAGGTDVALSDRGREQAGRLTGWAAQAGLAGVWCSPLVRARETAEIAIGDTRLALHVDPRLAELDFGEAEGLTVEQMRERFPDRRRAFERDPIVAPLPGGEPPREALHRALDCLREIAAGDDDGGGGGRVLVVIHTTLIRLLVCHLLGLPLKDYRRRLPTVSYATLTELRLEDDQAALLSFNAPPAPASDQ